MIKLATQKTTKLGTTLVFGIYDFQGQKGFPEGKSGLVFEHLENRTIFDKNTGLPIKRDERYIVVHTDGGRGWRIDSLPRVGPKEAIYGVEESRPAFWPTAEKAALALEAYLDEVAHTTTRL